MEDSLPRVALALGLTLGLAFGLSRLRMVPRDVALVGFAAVVVVLGIFAFLGPAAAAIGAAIVLLVVAVGAAIFGLLALAARWASR
jgi:hypothetical protein